MDVRFGPWTRLSAKELMLLNCSAGEDSQEFLVLQWDEISQPWIFIRKTGAESEAPIFQPPDAKRWPFGKDPDARKDWGQEEKGVTEYEMFEQHYWLSRHEFEQAPGDGEPGKPPSCTSKSCKESYITLWLNNNNSSIIFFCWLKKFSHPVTKANHMV